MAIWIALVFSLAINIVGFLIAYRNTTDKLTDFSYGLSFIMVAIFGFIIGGQHLPGVIILAMTIIWALRLAVFLLVRIMRTKRDKRFDGVRENFWKFGKFWTTQGLVAWVLLLPSLIVLTNEHARFKPYMIIGIAVWALGLAIEALADLQKYRFTRNPANKNKWIESGLWAYSRHPNYLGEMTVWVGMLLFCLGNLEGAERLLGLVSPLTIIALLLFVSGIPPLEKDANKRWGGNPAYQRYKKRVPALIPLPGKRT